MVAGNDDKGREEQRRFETIGIYVLGLIAIYATFRSNPDIMREVNVALVGEEAYSQGMRMTWIPDATMLFLALFCITMIARLIPVGREMGWTEKMMEAMSLFTLFGAMAIGLLFASYLIVSTIVGTGDPRTNLGIAFVLTAAVLMAAVLWILVRPKLKRSEVAKNQ